MSSPGVVAYLTALGATVASVLLLVGAGALVSLRIPLGSVLERAALRLALGMALLPTIQIALFEAFGLRVSLVSALVVGGAGWLLILRDRLRAHEPLAQEADSSTFSRDLPLLLLSLAVFFACLKGAMRFPTFEGRDPWGHALGIQYILDTGQLRQPFPSWPTLQYIDAYPPLFDVLMALPCRLAGSINLPLKAMNAVLVGAVNLLLYGLVLRLTGSRARALVATLLYVFLPGNLTRHVWGHSVAILLLLAGLAMVVECRDSRRGVIPGALCFSGAILAAPSQGIVNGVLLVVSALAVLAVARVWTFRVLAMGMLALVTSLIWFGPVFARYGTSPRALASAMQMPELRRSGLTETARDAPSPFAGASPRTYNVDDVLFFRPYEFVLKVTKEKRMDDIVPGGLGAVVSVAMLFFMAHTLGQFLRSKRLRPTPIEARESDGWRVLALSWLVVSLVGLFGVSLGFAFFTWRFWLVVCPFACLAAADSLVSLAESAPSRRTRLAIALIFILAAVDVGLALESDLTVPGSPWRYLALNLPFLGIPVAAALLWSAERRIFANTRGAILATLLLAHVVVAAPARLRILTHYVPPKGFFDAVELEGYLETARLTPPGSRVLPLSGGDRASYLAGLDRPSLPGDADELAFQRRGSLEKDALCAAELVAWLRGHGYAAVVLDPSYRDQSPRLFTRYARELTAQPGVKIIVLRNDPVTHEPAFVALSV